MHSFIDLPAKHLIKLYKYLDLKDIANLLECSHFFSDNYYLLNSFNQKKLNYKFETEFKTIFDTQLRRVFSLTADFSNIDSNTKSIKLLDVPCLKFSNISPTIFSQLLDHGRSSSFLTNQKYNTSFIHDVYHRDGQTKAFGFGLIGAGTSMETENKGEKIVFYDEVLTIVMFAYLFNEELNINEMVSNRQLKNPIRGENYLPPAIIIKETKCQETIVKLGFLGALPSRDQQLKIMNINHINKLKGIRKLYLDNIKISSNFPIDLNLKNEYLDLAFTVSEKIQSISNNIESICNIFPHGIEYEQRKFYSELIKNIFRSINLQTYTLTQQQKIQTLLSLQRLENLLQPLQTVSYTSFLRISETCIDELTVLLSIKSEIDSVLRSSIVNDIYNFIEKTVGFRPQIATLRNSCMQAINHSFFASLFYLHEKIDKSSICVRLDPCVYYEISKSIGILFNITNYEEDLSLEFFHDRRCKPDKVTNDPLRIYDIYIANFESNIIVSRNQFIFSNINRFIKDQFNLRKKQGCMTRQLICLLDNTMSDFNEVYLPLLLKEFEDEILFGALCVIVSHSGNKYLHLGLDKELSALCYGYYDPESFASLFKNFKTETYENATVAITQTTLLTHAFITQAQDQILAYSTLLRLRTAWIFNNIIPKELLSANNYIFIQSPYYNATEDELKIFNKTQNTNSTFIIIRINHHKFHFPDIYEKVTLRLSKLLIRLGIYSRDGFGFSQNTQICFSNNPQYPRTFRISIGTEDLNILSNNMSLICQYILMINSIMNNYPLTKNISINSKALLKQISEKSNQAKIDFKPEKNKYEFSCAFFSKPNITAKSDAPNLFKSVCSI